MSALVSPADLQKIIQYSKVKVLDASYKFPPYDEGIPGARDFDIDDIADPQAKFPHTVPTPQLFARKVSALGVGSDHLAIVYDRGGVSMAAARVWWMFRLFGHENVRILNGGLPAWMDAGCDTAAKPEDRPEPATFNENFRPELLKLIGQMTENLKRKSFSVLDARDTKRFEAGHIPGSLSVPYLDLVAPDGKLKPTNELAEIFEAAGADLEKSITCTCGSGVTACVIALALYELGHKDAAVYDGSWTEWSASLSLPKEQGK